MPEFEFVCGISGLQPHHRGCVVTIGAFDGVHLGHARLIQKLKEASKRLSLPSVVMVLEPQPNEYFQGKSSPARLMRLREKVLALKAQGVDRVICLRFNKELRSYEAQRFLELVLINKLGIKYLVVGDDFRFGCDRKGDFTFLKSQAGIYDFEVVDTGTLLAGSERISSTYIRQVLAASRFEEAASLLGRPYRNLGRVSYGNQLGRTIGFPTLNIGLRRIVCPFVGVFAVNTYIDGVEYPSVANVGIRPSVNQRVKPALEVHILDQGLDLYGKWVEVEYLKKIRAEQKFDSVNELKKQIERDVLVAREFFGARTK